jgi:hypothetical protein
MSLYLVSDFDYEMRDVVGTPEDIFYSFIGAPNLLTGQDLEKFLSENVFGLDAKEIIDLLLWYGFLGVVGPSTEPIFIYVAPMTSADLRRNARTQRIKLYML